MSIHKSSFLIFTAFIFFLVCNSSLAQDTLTIKGIKIADDDSLKARYVLNNVIPPDSEFWIMQQQKPGNYAATNMFSDIAEIAYPMDPSNINTAYIDSILTFYVQVYDQQSNEDLRALFLYKAVQLSQLTGKKDLLTKYYSILKSEFSDSQYTTRATAYAPERAIQDGKIVPNFSIPTLEDTTRSFTNEDFNNQIYLVDFWGTWCGPCRVEMPYLHEAFEKYQGEGFEILSVALHDEYDAVKTFRENEWQMPWSHSFIEDNSVLEDNVVSKFEVYAVPKTFLVNKEGIIIATDVDLRGERLLNTLENIFNKQ
ncbi:TlpA family protein disulfide reductase [Rhodohalobacter sp. 8-1]|uniref:TlpA family protein disulfide reductase n=1 Tax=Rhodohalobacter sp. 8-1 TaxID=3131972 RepID=UPI0030EEC36A